MKPRLLDLFCGAGGAAMGYHRAGFEVVGVDIKPQPRYPFEFHQADAMTYPLEGFDAIHASPPCQRYTMAQNAAKNASAHPDLVDPVRARLATAGVPWVIENVVGAPLRNAITLCGLAFGLCVKRHRLFESNQMLLAPPCPSHDVDYYVIFGHEVRNRRHGEKAGRKNRIAEGRKAMGIDWMTRGELSEAIPPAYTEFIGKQLLEAIR
jgi:DNA (cytosine-5)-methyltransferase 1